MDKQSSELNSSLTKETRPERKHLTDLDQIVHRHLNDENDKITEEDIRDAVIGFPEKSAEI
ncbi:MAG: hypothetical protein ABI151_02155 [Chitinophagaceae bacterium]